MAPDQWLGIAAGLLLVAAAVALASYGMSGGRLWSSGPRRFVCPLSRQNVECVLARDIRTGQFQRVESCTAFPDPGDVRCAEDCRSIMNLGLPMAGEQGRP